MRPSLPDQFSPGETDGKIVDLMKGGLQFVGDGFFNVVDLHSHKSVDQLFGVEAGRAPLDPQDGR